MSETLHGWVAWLLEGAPLPVLVGILAGAIVAIVIAATRAAKASLRIRNHPFEPRRRILTAGEARFLRALESALDGRIRIMVKMRIADLLRVRDGLDVRAHHKAFERIARRHVDFVLLDADSLTLLAVIELDFGAADNAGAPSDNLVDQIFAAAGVPLLRTQIRSRYDPAELARQVQALLGHDQPV